MSERGPVLGIDYGSRRIGLAISDAEGVFAFPEPALVVAKARDAMDALCTLVRDRGIAAIVVGLPIHLDGRPGEQAERTRKFADQLADATGVPVSLLDERLTTREAERALVDERGGSRRRRRQRGDVDSAAAAILLRTFLERERALAARAELP